ncbi:hypothetical protein RND71_028333 [Anisodus tanguticus]|uniref:Uncharacterized protein n=1 Tax=Anisodus tanguticus TaxID=243964 RepID=A0AAE1RJL2_9SOLA|nr:hypothetical protein RND71_028333 [Anisodus tanguticus]
MGPLPSLKFIELSWCYNVEGLEVDASNLESSTYIGNDILVAFQNIRYNGVLAEEVM